MIVKGLIDEDVVNYKKCGMTIMFPKCSFKCDKDCGREVCQNSPLATSENIEIEISDIMDRYKRNGLNNSLICMGLEPLDTFYDLISIIKAFRGITMDDIVIYTGYTKKEAINETKVLSKFENVIIKYGRYIPDQKSHYDEVLGVYLASDNQYAEKIS